MVVFLRIVIESKKYCADSHFIKKSAEFNYYRRLFLLSNIEQIAIFLS